MKKVVKLSPIALRKLISETVSQKRKLNEDASASQSKLREDLKSFLTNYLNDLYDPNNSQHEDFGPMLWSEQAEMFVDEMLPDMISQIEDAATKLLQGDFVVG